MRPARSGQLDRAHPLRLTTACAIAAGVVCVSTPALRAQRSVQSSAEIRIGGPGDTVLADVRKIVMLRSGIAVLDSRAPFVKVYDADGRFLGATGGFGVESGQFRSPLGMAYDYRRNEIVVVDAANRRATWIAIKPNIRTVTELGLPLSASDICLGRENYYVLGLDSGRIVHEVVRKGDSLVVRHSFGVPNLIHPLADNAMVQRRMAAGMMACSSDEHTVFTASFDFGDLQILTWPAGKQETLRVLGEHPIDVSVRGHGLAFQAPANGIYDETAGLIPTQTGVRVEIGVTSKEHVGNGDFAAYREVDVSNDGHQLAAGGSIEHLMAMSTRQVVCYTPPPQPALIIRRGAKCR